MIINLDWMILALLAATCWGVVNVCDKRILSNSNLKIETRQFIDSVVGLFIASTLAFNLFNSSILLILIGILAGIIVYAHNFLYYHSLRQADVSAISVYLQSIPIFSAMIGFIFFAERFSVEVYFGSFLVLLGAVTVATERTKSGGLTVFLGKNMAVLVKYILPASLLMSISYGLTKLLLVQYSFWEVFFWGRIGFSCFGLLRPIYTQKSKFGIIEDLKVIEFKTLYDIVLIEFVNFLGLFFLIAAYATGTITLVSIVAAVQPLIVVIVVVSVAILNDETPLKDFSSSKQVFLVRVGAILLQLVGIIILFQNYHQ